MKYLSTMSKLIYEGSDGVLSTKELLYKGLSNVASNSHIVNDQISDNLEIFLRDLNVGKLIEAIGGDIKSVLGNGAFGGVFELDNNKVMKVTFDYREAPFVYEYGLKKRTKGIVKVDKVFKIKFGSTYAYLIIRKPLIFIKNTKMINDIIYDLKENGVSDEIVKKYREIGGLEYKIFLAFKAMYNMDPNWRGTHSGNVAKQKGQIVLYDGFSKNIKLSDEEIPFLDIETEKNFESMVNKKSLDQLKKIRKMMKGIDIGDRIADESFPNSTSHHNINDVHIQSYEEYMDEPFKVNQNIKTFKPKK